MSLYEKLQHARSEEDVKDIYIKALGLKGYNKNLIDIQTKEIWFEAKDNHKVSTYAMFTQLLHYVQQALDKGEYVPPFLVVIDTQKAAIMKSSDVIPFLKKKTIKWGFTFKSDLLIYFMPKRIPSAVAVTDTTVKRIQQNVYDTIFRQTVLIQDTVYLRKGGGDSIGVVPIQSAPSPKLKGIIAKYFDDSSERDGSRNRRRQEINNTEKVDKYSANDYLTNLKEIYKSVDAR